VANTPHTRTEQQLGARVSTRAGHQLGTVKAISDDAFKVDAPLERDYWLSLAWIRHVEATYAALTIDLDGVQMCRVER